jgi:hypothetical protein
MGGNSAPGGTGALLPRLRRLRVLAAAAALAAVQAASACTSSPAPETTGEAPTATAGQGPIAVELNQLRDQYGKPEVQLQLTNTSDAAVTVSQAEVISPFFQGAISWMPAGGGLELPPGQPKSLPAALPAATCGGHPSPDGETAKATVLVTSPGQSRPRQLTFNASDPFGVLRRNNGELCLATAVAAVADIRLGTQLEVAPDARTAVVHLVVAPQPAADGKDPDQAARILSIRSIGGTPLLAEAPRNPWPENLTVRAGDGPRQFPCISDPPAVTRMPLRRTRWALYCLSMSLSTPGRELSAFPQERCYVRNFMTLLRARARRVSSGLSVEVSPAS